MVENDEWQVFKWYCPNCGYVVQGLKNKEGTIKVECSRCRAAMVRVPKSRRKDVIYLTAPYNHTHIEEDLNEQHIEVR